MTTMTHTEFNEIVRQVGEKQAKTPRYIGTKLSERVPAAIETIISQGAKFADPRHSFSVETRFSSHYTAEQVAQQVSGAIESLMARPAMRVAASLASLRDRS